MLVMMAQKHSIIWNVSSEPPKVDQIMCTVVEVLSGSHPIRNICKWETTYGIERPCCGFLLPECWVMGIAPFSDCVVPQKLVRRLFHRKGKKEEAGKWAKRLAVSSTWKIFVDLCVRDVTKACGISWHGNSDNMSIRLEIPRQNLNPDSGMWEWVMASVSSPAKGMVDTEWPNRIR